MIQRPTQESTQAYADGIGQKIEPFARAACGTRGLQYFQQAPHQHGSQHRKNRQFGIVYVAMSLEILPPNNQGKSTIHNKVHPLVYKTDIVQRRFRESGNKREYPYRHKNNDGYPIMFQIIR